MSAWCAPPAKDLRPEDPTHSKDVLRPDDPDQSPDVIAVQEGLASRDVLRAIGFEQVPPLHAVRHVLYTANQMLLPIFDILSVSMLSNAICDKQNASFKVLVNILRIDATPLVLVHAVLLRSHQARASQRPPSPAPSTIDTSRNVAPRQGV